MKSLNPIYVGMICAGGQKDKGICYGDSGSSLHCYIDSKWIHTGIASWVKSGCDSDGYPNVFTRVSYYSDWIYSKINY
jgi:secreted trypsin-like serine protease